MANGDLRRVGPGCPIKRESGEPHIGRGSWSAAGGGDRVSICAGWSQSLSAFSLRQPTSPVGAMTTTTTFKGVDPNSRNSSRIGVRQRVREDRLSATRGDTVLLRDGGVVSPQPREPADLRFLGPLSHSRATRRLLWPRQCAGPSPWAQRADLRPVPADLPALVPAVARWIPGSAQQVHLWQGGAGRRLPHFQSGIRVTVLFSECLRAPNKGETGSPPPLPTPTSECAGPRDNRVGLMRSDSRTSALPCHLLHFSH
ncbi:hypothetical protein LEMLEM_LOCUS27737 [Lemmus lemmus]